MMMILEITEGTEFDQLPVNLIKAIRRLGGVFVGYMMEGTEPVNGKQIILTDIQADKATVEHLTNNDVFDDEGNQIGFDLGWSVLAVEGEPVDQSLLLPYYKDVPVFDPETETTSFEPVTDLTGKIQTWSGRNWTY